MYKLDFNIAKNPAFKVASFNSPAEQQSYIDAETKDEVCSNAYYEFQSARNIEQRRKAANKLDRTRWNFYKEYTSGAAK